MINTRSVYFYLLLFIPIAILLKIFGIINFKSGEIISYFLLIAGMSLFYHSFLKENRTGIFLGSTLFLIGIFLFTANYFELINTGKILIPSLLIITAVGLLLGYFLISKDKFALTVSLSCLIIGTTILIYRSDTTFNSYLYAIMGFLELYWVIILVSVGIVLIISYEVKKELK